VIPDYKNRFLKLFQPHHTPGLRLKAPQIAHHQNERKKQNANDVPKKSKAKGKPAPFYYCGAGLSH
jgi:hypothetical protein